MSTHAAIIAKLGDRFHGIYCHSDGYLRGVGVTLLAHYSTPEKVAQLIALGDLSALGEEIGEKHDFDWRHTGRPSGESFDAMVARWQADPRARYCRAYHRDRGEPLRIAQSHSWAWLAREIESDFDGAQFNYVYEGDAWHVATANLSFLLPLAQAAELATLAKAEGSK